VKGYDLHLIRNSDVQIQIGNVLLQGRVAIPEQAKGMVLFSHGSGSSRFSPRNQKVAHKLQEAGFGTLLFDLLTEQEDATYSNRFDLELLTKRLIAVTIWMSQQPYAESLPLAYFGASTGAASALKAAIALPQIQTVVCRGGRPDLVLDLLPQIQIPVLLIVGEQDEEVLELNLQAMKALPEGKELCIITGATHLFEEPGKMEEVSNLAVHWFLTHLKTNK
jgi:dienelactone hydrolase